MTEVTAPEMAATAEPSAPLEHKSRRLAAAAFVRGAALLPVIGVLLIIGSLVSPVFLTISNLAGVGQQSSALGVVVIGESLIIMIGGMDLSLESTYGLAPMVAAWLMVPVAAYGTGAELAPVLGILVLLAVGAAIGLINGFAIVKGRLNGFIWTLGMTIVCGGIQDGMVNGQSLYDLPTAFTWLGSDYVGPIPVSLIATALLFIGVGLFLRYHRSGAGSSRSAVTARRRAQRAFASIASASACTSPAACSPRSAA